MNQKIIEALSERILNDTNSAMTPFIKYANESGFSKVEPIPIEHFMWKFYRLTP